MRSQRSAIAGAGRLRAGILSEFLTEKARRPAGALDNARTLWNADHSVEIARNGISQEAEP